MFFTKTIVIPTKTILQKKTMRDAGGTVLGKGKLHLMVVRDKWTVHANFSHVWKTGQVQLLVVAGFHHCFGVMVGTLRYFPVGGEGFFVARVRRVEVSHGEHSLLSPSWNTMISMPWKLAESAVKNTTLRRSVNARRQQALNHAVAENPARRG